MIVLAAEEEILLLVERVAAPKLATVFDRLIIMEDVQVQDISEDFEVLGVTGPRSKEVIQALGLTSTPDGLYSHSRFETGRIVQSDLGYELIVPRQSGASVLQNLVTAGAVNVSEPTWTVLRAEAGLPLYGVDIDETTTMPELGQRGINYDKGCYIGQEVVARIKYIGHVNRQFVGFLCEGSSIPEQRAAVILQNKEVGYITTAVLSPRLQKVIALGFVNRVAAQPDTEVSLVGKDGSISARVTSLPFAPFAPFVPTRVG
jgi:aminomethyltransferase